MVRECLVLGGWRRVGECLLLSKPMPSHPPLEPVRQGRRSRVPLRLAARPDRPNGWAGVPSVSGRGGRKRRDRAPAYPCLLDADDDGFRACPSRLEIYLMKGLEASRFAVFA